MTGIIDSRSQFGELEFLLSTNLMTKQETNVITNQFPWSKREIGSTVPLMAGNRRNLSRFAARIRLWTILEAFLDFQILLNKICFGSDSESVGRRLPEIALIERFGGILGRSGQQRDSLGHKGVLQIGSRASWIRICKNTVNMLNTLHFVHQQTLTFVKIVDGCPGENRFHWSVSTVNLFGRWGAQSFYYFWEKKTVRLFSEIDAKTMTKFRFGSETFCVS